MTEKIVSPITVDPESAVGKLRFGPDAPVWEQAIDHRFVREIFAGEISDAVLADYLIQDYQFFDAFLSMLGACVAHADQLEPKLRFCKQLCMLVNDEDDYFQKAFAILGVSAKDYTNPPLSRAASGFEKLMRDAVESKSYPHLLVMLTIAEWLYLDWGSRKDPMPEKNLHTEWIELHRGEAFQAWCQFLIDELNRVWPAAEAAGMADALRERWSKAVALELDFFEVSYQRSE